MVMNNISSVAILLSVNRKNAITDVWLTESFKKLPTLAPPGCVKNAALVSVHITLIIIYSQKFYIITEVLVPYFVTSSTPFARICEYS